MHSNSRIVDAGGAVDAGVDADAGGDVDVGVDIDVNVRVDVDARVMLMQSFWGRGYVWNCSVLVLRTATKRSTVFP